MDVHCRKYEDEIEILPESNALNLSSRNKVKKLSSQDKKSVCLLTFLYILQGIPLGLAGSVPLILQSRKVSYSTQATFSLVFWPFSLKILWAPIVDSVYSNYIGRRKTWLIPTQLLIGMMMLYASFNVDGWLSPDIQIIQLTSCFFLLNFLAATQDIAVDGWALTMLSRSSVGWASTCNSVGQTAGYFIAYIIFLALESAEFCNSWLRTVPQSTGVVTFEGFLYFWGIVFIITTLFVMIFKRENNSNGKTDDESDVNNEETDISLGLWETYQTLWQIVKLNPIKVYVISLFFIKIGFSANDSITGLKLIEKGVSKEKMAFIGSLVVPVQILLAVVVSKYTTGPRPLDTFIKSAFPRMLYGLFFLLFVYWTPSFQQSDGSYLYSFYLVLFFLYTSHQMFVYPMFVSVMAFYARISDPAIGGTYMTFLNTVTNLSGNIPNTVMLYLVDYLTIKNCVGGPSNGLPCNSKVDLDKCTGAVPKGTCITSLDGYYLETVGCMIIGLIAIFYRRRYLYYVQELSLDCWRVFPKR